MQAKTKCKFCGKDIYFSDLDVLPPNGLELAIAVKENLGVNVVVVICTCGSVKLINTDKLSQIEFKPDRAVRAREDSVVRKRRQLFRRGMMKFRLWRMIYRMLNKPKEPIEPIPHARECCLCETTWWCSKTSSQQILSINEIGGLTCQFCGRSFCKRCYGQSLPKVLPGGDCPACGAKLTGT